MRDGYDVGPSGALTITAGSAVIGIVIETLKHRWASVWNVATMASLFIWMIAIAFFQTAPHAELQGEANLAGGLMLVLSTVPLCLTLITSLIYKTLDVDQDKTVTLDLQ